MASSTHSRRFSRDALVAQPDMELPAYTRRTRSDPATTRTYERVEHTFCLTDSARDKPWATMTIQSNAKSHKHLPTFFQGDDVLGTVDLSLARGDAVVSVGITVRGRIITGANASDVYTFLEITQNLWSKSDPANTPRVFSGHSSTYENTTDAKLYGEYTWPINISLPKTVCTPNGSGTGTELYRLPASFVERYTRASIQYDITLTIRRTKLRSDSQLTTSFTYVPLIRSEAPSILRQLATQGGFMPPSPEADPEGWSQPHLAITRFAPASSRPISAKCKLYVSQPLSFTRGTTLPVTLDVECQDPQGLRHILDNPHCTTVSLRRRVKYFLQTAWGLKQGAGWHEDVEDICAANWWPLQGIQAPASCDFAHRLSGEIRIPKDVKPTTQIAHFSVSYSIIFAPADSTATATTPLVELPIHIGTHHAKGVRGHTVSPPEYDAE